MYNLNPSVSLKSSKINPFKLHLTTLQSYPRSRTIYVYLSRSPISRQENFRRENFQHNWVIFQFVSEQGWGRYFHNLNIFLRHHPTERTFSSHPFK